MRPHTWQSRKGVHPWLANGVHEGSRSGMLGACTGLGGICLGMAGEGGGSQYVSYLEQQPRGSSASLRERVPLLCHHPAEVQGLGWEA